MRYRCISPLLYSPPSCWSMPDLRVVPSSSDSSSQPGRDSTIGYDPPSPSPRNGGLEEKLNERNFSFAEGAIEPPSRLIDLPLRESLVCTRRTIERGAFSVEYTHRRNTGRLGTPDTPVSPVTRGWNSTTVEFHDSATDIAVRSQRRRHPPLSLSLSFP